MSDTLEIFGQEYTNVAGFKATDDNDTIKTYIRPQGNLAITANSASVDVSQYATASVAVPSVETNFIVTVSWNSSTSRYEPNKTFSEIQTAYNAGKTIAVVSDEQSSDNAVDGEYHTGANPYFEYWVRKYLDGYSPQTIREIGYHLTSTGINTEDDINYIRPSGNLAITQNGNNIDVANYSTVSVNVSGSSKNIQVNQTGGYVRTNGYTSTGVSLTVAKAGTYKVSWTAWRSSSQGTMGTNLYKNSTAGTAQQTWTSTYGQHITLTNQTYAQGDILTLYATAGSTSRYCYVGDLVIVEQ